jgi:NAD(P)-dependent dehydrogenase (short-subunit alcohol dehydrogenase family)
MTDEPLLGRHALIMGVPADVAEPIALALAQAGADVALTTATNDAEEAFSLRRITRGVRALGRQSMNESVDMSIGTAVQIAMRQVAKELGGIDILVAGPDLRIDKATERLTDADWSRLLNTNLSAVFYACRSAYREMGGGNTEQGTGNKGAIVILLPPVDDAADAGYAAARAGVEALVAGLARQWTASGVSVKAVGFETPAAGVLAAITQP